MSKVWLITGSSRGLGRAFTVAALEAGIRSWPVRGRRNNWLTWRTGSARISAQFRSTSPTKRKRTGLSRRRSKPSEAWTSLSTMRDMGMSVRLKIRQSRIFGSRSRQIFSVSSS